MNTDARQQPLSAQAALVECYAALHASEDGQLQTLTQKLLSDPHIGERYNMAGHLTGSIYIVNPELTRVLMIDHISSGKVLQPGGHLDAGESPVQGAMREAVEETGIGRAEFRTLDALGPMGGLFDIDTHAIAARPAKGEGAHVHHDFAFLRIVDEQTSLVAQAVEVGGMRWLDMDDVARMDNSRHQRVAQKIKVLAQASLDSSPEEESPGAERRRKPTMP